LNINAFLSENTWVSDARWKFVLGHEFGHMVQGFANAFLPARYLFNGDTSIQSPLNFSSWTPAMMDPDSANEVAASCTCDLIEEGPNRGHCLQSVEVSASAQQEGYGHFMAARIWNLAAVDPGFNFECSFGYYKQVGAPNLTSGGTAIPPVTIDCSQAYAHRDTACDEVDIIGHEEGTEVDWLTFFQAVTTDASHPVTVSDLLSWYRNACGGTCNGSTFVTYSQWRNGAPSALHSWLDGLAGAHGVN
jgi:hypothetical protein